MNSSKQSDKNLMDLGKMGGCEGTVVQSKVLLNGNGIWNPVISTFWIPSGAEI